MCNHVTWSCEAITAVVSLSLSLFVAFPSWFYALSLDSFPFILIVFFRLGQSSEACFFTDGASCLSGFYKVKQFYLFCNREAYSFWFERIHCGESLLRCLQEHLTLEWLKMEGRIYSVSHDEGIRCFIFSSPHHWLEKLLQDASINGVSILVLFIWHNGVASVDN